MKKIVILLILISLLICPLCSCQQKNITVGDVTGDLYFEETDCGMNIMFNDVKYNVFAGDLKGFYFYRATDQLVTYLWGRLGLYGLYVVNNPDFGLPIKRKRTSSGVKAIPKSGLLTTYNP